MQLDSPTKSIVRKGNLNENDKYSERFIPNRTSLTFLSSFDKLSDDRVLLSQNFDEHHAAYSTLLHSQLSQAPNSGLFRKTLFKFSPEHTGKENQVAEFTSEEIYSPLKSQRKIPKSPYKVLDAPALQDDFYLNLLDWSCSNQLSVGLGSCVYIWNATNSKVTKLCDLGLNDSVTSVAWSQNGTNISVGTNKGTILLWDAQRSKLIRSFSGHTGRVGSLAWNNRILTSGSRDRQILHRDIRAANDSVAKLCAHKQEVCGLKWSFDEQQLSSGGNDNKLMLWNLHSTQPVSKFSSHNAAVKAMAWSPHQYGLLASGGGTADRTIRYWNTLTSEQIHCVDTGSQVCNLVFSKNTKELVSTHGYSLNQIILWKDNDYSKVATLTGHTYRVLYLAMSPDGQTVVTGAGDETLRFWEMFPDSNNSNEGAKNCLLPSVFDLR
ncbi:hypothetical protein SteCoe_1089 [Stentor coeruleus]|uniref:CDC20/Fizzy WD40 domain-containing protein n=1 Tax=Stentor coeruleus TaxID=5963 RepID=A0A1R2D2K2_9CILI|nr:hypothetical protein SteCoe_1089 [Stentor coeruleus]